MSVLFMDQPLISILSFFLGLCSGFIGALSSGGGLISIPGLIIMGLPPSTAVATTRLNVLAGGFASIYKYHSAKMVEWNRTIKFVPLAIAGGVLGSFILLQIDERILEKIVGILLLLLAPLLAFGKNFGLENIRKNEAHHRIGLLVLILVMTYNAFFGGGGGTFLIYTLIYFFGMSIIQANANGIFLGMFTAATSLLVFLPAGSVNFSYGIPMMAGAVIGSYWGAHTAIKKGNEFVRWVFLVIVIGSSIKLLFF